MRISYAWLFFLDASATVFDIAWSHAKFISPWPPPDADGELSALTHAVVSDLTGRGVRIIGDAFARRVRRNCLQHVKLTIPAGLLKIRCSWIGQQTVIKIPEEFWE